ncbi:MAG: ACP S-malonyltransferase [Planctomycetota bacterium]
MVHSAVIFPGQGAQTIGMGRDFADQSDCARRVYDQANGVLGFDLATICFEGPAEQLERTDIQQPAIFVTSVAIWETYREAAGRAATFSHAGGLSLGEYTALYAAGSIEFADALRLVRRRGELMQTAALTSPGGMVSLIGADEAQAHALCERAAHGETLTPANFNCPGQIVIAGTKDACARAVALADEFGCRAVPLALAGAFHSPLMAPAADGFGHVLNGTDMRHPSMRVIANVNADYHGDAASIRESLRRQLTHPVLWRRSVERLIADGVKRFVEIGPGRVLTGLMRKINRSVMVDNISTAAGLVEALGAAKAG